MRDQPPPAVGAYWIKEEDYPALLKIFDDGSKMPRTWKDFRELSPPGCLNRPILAIRPAMIAAWRRPTAHARSWEGDIHGPRSRSLQGAAAEPIPATRRFGAIRTVV
jgi:hypothetical protein